MISDEDLARVSAKGRLVPQANDEQLAAELMASMDYLDAQGPNWRNHRDNNRTRAARIRLEGLFETSSRRWLGYPAIAGKFAMGGLWSPSAMQRVEMVGGKPAEMAIPGVTKAQSHGHPDKLLLEHVVPASTLLFVTRQMMAADQQPAEIASMLRGSMMHAVLTNGDEKVDPSNQARALPQTMPGQRIGTPDSWGFNPTETDAMLADHFTGRGALSQSDLNRVLWARYEHGEQSGLLGFDRGDLDDMSERLEALAPGKQGNYNRSARKPGAMTKSLTGEKHFDPARKARHDYFMAQADRIAAIAEPDGSFSR